jgi:dephospho-CoA kinase
VPSPDPTSSDDGADPTSDTDLRDEVHLQLAQFLGPGGVFEDPRYNFDTDVTNAVARIYLDSQADVARGGAMAVVTAGPPGAGKSTSVEQVEDLDTYRRVDADEIKDLLLELLAKAGELDFLTAVPLVDGRPLMRRELAGWVHPASTSVWNRVVRASMRRRENIVIEGTLKYGPLAEEYDTALRRFRYDSLHIIDVEVDEALAIESARQRWWYGRRTDPLGGRFMLDEWVHEAFLDATHSKCAVTADELWDRTWQDFDVVYERVTRTGDGETTALRRQSQKGFVVGDIFPPAAPGQASARPR